MEVKGAREFQTKERVRRGLVARGSEAFSWPALGLLDIVLGEDWSSTVTPLRGMIGTNTERVSLRDKAKVRSRSMTSLRFFTLSFSHKIN